MKRSLILFAMAGVACRHPRWRDKVATELHVAGFTIGIPDGWRSLAELSDGQPEGKLAADTVGMMPETDLSGVLTASVLITSRQLADPPPWRTCAEAAENARSHDSPPISELHDGGEACTWHVSMNRLVATIGIRKIGTAEVTVQCLIDAAGDPSAERVCDRVLTALHVR